MPVVFHSLRSGSGSALPWKVKLLAAEARVGQEEMFGRFGLGKKEAHSSG